MDNVLDLEISAMYSDFIHLTIVVCCLVVHISLDVNTVLYRDLISCK